MLTKRGGDTLTPQQLYRDLRAKFPAEEVGPRALFAVAEAMEAGDPRSAVETFAELCAKYPDDMMVPKAMLKSAAVHARALNDPEQARALIARIGEQYAGTPYANQAEKLLA